MSGVVVASGEIDRAAAEPFAVGTVQWIRRPGDGGRPTLSSGYWFVSPEQAPDPITVTAHADECVHIVEGRVRIQPEGGEPIELGPGGSASVTRGDTAVWTVLEPTIEFFVYA